MEFSDAVRRESPVDTSFAPAVHTWVPGQQFKIACTQPAMQVGWMHDTIETPPPYSEPRVVHEHAPTPATAPAHFEVAYFDPRSCKASKHIDTHR